MGVQNQTPINALYPCFQIPNAPSVVCCLCLHIGNGENLKILQICKPENLPTLLVYIDSCDTPLESFNLFIA